MFFKILDGFCCFLLFNNGLDARGSPARAGIGPGDLAASGHDYGFPRASGDRPIPVGYVSASLGVPPRERG